MEPTTHPFSKENDLNQTFIIVFHVNFLGCNPFCGEDGGLLVSFPHGKFHNESLRTWEEHESFHRCLHRPWIDPRCVRIWRKVKVDEDILALTKWYCWWKNSCTGWYGKYPIFRRVLYMSGGAGFLPSTVVWLQFDSSKVHFNMMSTFCLVT